MAKTIILPIISQLQSEIETINDLLTHNSEEIKTNFLEEKTVYIIAKEVIAAGTPGSLWCWIEISPLSSTDPRWNESYYSAIGGGGGLTVNRLPVIPPMTPLITPASGVNGRTHSLVLTWSAPSNFARLVVQTPAAATPTTDYWEVQARFGFEGLK